MWKQQLVYLITGYVFTDETLLDNVETAIGVLDYRVCFYRRDTLR